MRYNNFDELKISALGFGTMRLPLQSDGSIDYAEGEKMVAEAMAGGITYFDTAYRYHEGESENFCGKVLSKYQRDTYFLADKLPTWLCATVEDAEKIFADQLEKCRTDYFDFYLLHNVDEESWPNIEKLDLVNFVAGKKAAGLARHVLFRCQRVQPHALPRPGLPAVIHGLHHQVVQAIRQILQDGARLLRRAHPAVQRRERCVKVLPADRVVGFPLG